MGRVERLQRREERAERKGKTEKAERLKQKVEKVQQKTHEATQNLAENITDFDKTRGDTRRSTESLKQEIPNLSEEQVNDALERMSNVNIDEIRSINTYEGLFKVIDKLKSDLKILKKGKKHGLQDSWNLWKKEVKKKAKEWLKVLSQREKSAEKDQKLGKQLTGQVYPAKLEEVWREVQYLNRDSENASTWVFSNFAHYPSWSIRQNRKASRRLEHTWEYQWELHGALKDRVVRESFDNNLQYANTFFQNAIAWTLSETDMVFYNQHGRQLISALESYPDLKNKVQNAYQSSRMTTTRYRGNGQGMDYYKDKGFLDAYREWGVYGVVEKLCSYTNMTPKYAKTVGSIATLATGIGAIYMAWKGGEAIAKGVVSEGTEIKWYHKLLGFWAVAAWWSLAANAVTGEGLMSCFDKFLHGGFSLDFLWWNDQPWEINTTEILSSIDGTNSILLAPACFHGKTIKDVREMKAKFQTDPSYYQSFRTAILQNMYNGTSIGRVAENVFPENYSEDKFESWLNSIGVTSLDQRVLDEILLEELAVVTFVLNTYKDQYQLAEGKTNLDLLHYIKAHKLSSMDEIQAHLSEMENDWILTAKNPSQTEDDDEDVDDDSEDDPEDDEEWESIVLSPTVLNHIDNLWGVKNTNTKKEIGNTMKKIIWENKKDGDTELVDLENCNWSLVGTWIPWTESWHDFTSYGTKTQIHVQESTIDDFEDNQNNEIHASSTAELLKWVNFVNKIKKACDGFEMNQLNFVVKEGKIVCWANEKTFVIPDDIPFIKNNVQFFANYLNTEAFNPFHQDH